MEVNEFESSANMEEKRMQKIGILQGKNSFQDESAAHSEGNTKMAAIDRREIPRHSIIGYRNSLVRRHHIRSIPSAP